MTKEDIDLHDQFAMASLTGLASCPEVINSIKNLAKENGISAAAGIASLAYELADAMIKERVKKCSSPS